MTLTDYLYRGRQLKALGHETDGCTFVNWIVMKFWPDAVNACWSHDFARRGDIPVNNQSENDNLFKDALKHFDVPRPMRFIMYTFTKSQGFMKDKFNMSLAAFLGFIFFLLVAAGMFYGASAQADNRIETKSTCHFAPDPNNDDNEPHASVCNNSIEPYDAGNGQGQLAYGETWAHRDYKVTDGAYPKSVGANTIARRGADASADQYDVWTDPKGNAVSYVETPNTVCTMVTHNRNNGADNYTEYVTNDYNAEYWWSLSPDNLGASRLHMHLVCRGGIAQ